MTNPTGKILIVDDDISVIETLEAILCDEHEIVFALDSTQAFDMAREEHPDLVLLDVLMPHCSGYELCLQLKKDPLTQAIPVIFLTSLESEADEALGLQVGAIDYIVKPMRPSIVRIRVRNHIELKLARDRLEQMALHDSLTGLINRRSLDERIITEYRRSRRQEKPLSIMMIDVDHFKDYNDQYGHPAGDDCLRSLAKCLSSVLRRPSDMVARYGGEEFIGVLPDTDYQGAYSVAQQIRQNLSQLNLVHEYSSVSDRVTVSIGIATARSQDIENIDFLIAQADQQLYRAKQEGRNRIYGADLEQD